MIKEITLVLSPKEASEDRFIRTAVLKHLKLSSEELTAINVIRKSIDARQRLIKFNVRVDAYINEKPKEELFSPRFKNVKNGKRVIVVGSGPAGLFAALRLIENGYKPIILERGKQVKERKLDIAKLNRESIIDEDSNYAFGEGGAGTFSDGKLYTRSKKRGNVKDVLDMLIFHGADANIGVDAHPHIGTNKLPRIIQKIRETILNYGGEFYFDHRVDGLILKDNKILGVEANGDKFEGDAVILATGHSARRIYELLHENNIKLEPKAFAMGVRVEHPQQMIDSIQYHCDIRDDYLPAAAYSLVSQVEDRGVYSFCMCPGGFIVPAATAPNEMVVNGMSPSMRNSKYANSGMVVQINIEDIPEYSKYGVLATLKYQQDLEHMAFINGGIGQVAPAQRLADFVKGKVSSDLPDTSYHPGIVSSPLHMWLPETIGARLQKGFKTFENRMKGFLTNEAVVLGVESRTSSPLRIPRDKQSLQHPQIEGLYPAGEGAGYAGGIVSAAVDGQRIADAIVS
ncbi:MAG: FAD-binding protein [Bacteroidetes bacterium]|nr:MAG: FAD-binding protein [Bacteroidota bacterium]